MRKRGKESELNCNEFVNWAINQEVIEVPEAPNYRGISFFLQDVVILLRELVLLELFLFRGSTMKHF